MRTYTAEQVREAVRGFAGYSHVHHGIGVELLDIATEYAALLRERESAKVVTDEMVECACDGFMRVRGIGMHLAWQSMTEETRISYRNAMRAALEAVAPMLASARVPDVMQLPEVLGMHAGNIATLKQYCYAYGWNDCRHAMLAPAPKPDKPECLHEWSINNSVVAGYCKKCGISKPEKE